MSTVEDKLESDGIDPEERMEILAEAADACRPRLFAIHGLRRGPNRDDILGWGMEFPDDEGAVFTEPPDGGVHLSDTAQRVFSVLSRTGDVRLTWFDTANPLPGKPF